MVKPLTVKKTLDLSATNHEIVTSLQVEYDTTNTMSGLTFISFLLALLLLPIGVACTSRTDDNSEIPNSHTEIEPEGENTDPTYEASLNYPERLETKYISTTDWPPQAAVSEQPFECTEGGEKDSLDGRTEQKTIGGRDFCVTKTTEGAAGSIYTGYTYAFGEGDNLIRLRFGLRFSQCANYDEPERDACETEQETFDVDALVNQMVNARSTDR